MLKNRWYPIFEAAQLRKKPIEIKRMGERWALWRDATGQARGLPATCPHRGASLAAGRIVDGELECPWHGFRFDVDGRCTLMPCEGAAARVPKAMHQKAITVREEHGLIWIWWGEEHETYPSIPFFDGLDEQPGPSETSYVLPYHYSRMMETNLDIHHTPFVHGNVIPVGTRVLDFEAHTEGDRIFSSGRLVKEKDVANGKTAGMEFRADLVLPNLVLIELTPKLRILICATPVDDKHSWMWFRYYQSYTRSHLLGKVITWISVQSEIRVVQKQDWRLFADMTPGTIDDFPYAFVHSDKAIALYRSLRAQHVEAIS